MEPDRIHETFVEKGVVQSGSEDVDLAFNLAHRKFRQPRRSGAALSCTSRGIKVGEVTFTDQLGSFRSHSATSMSAVDVDCADSRW